MAVPEVKPGKDGSPFWRFSLSFYALPGVAPACLALQDEAKADVNLMLYLFFLATQKRALGGGDIAKLDATVATWRKEVVQPLREIRRRLKGGISDVDSRANDEFREHVKGIELESERIEHDELMRHAPPLSFRADAASPLDAAKASLDAYGKFLGRLPAEPVKILLAAFAKL
jgi:uncharacterized protein (TIGR02444 family)